MALEQLELSLADTARAFEIIVERVKYLAESGTCNPFSLLHGLALSVVSLVSGTERERELALAFYVAALSDEMSRLDLDSDAYRKYLAMLCRRSSGSPAFRPSDITISR